ncbi:PhoH family protein [Ralstonia solanacearum]|uniref:Phosphate starvatioN-inducible ATPase, phoh-like protein n=1 Tax=Ralstonia solanacearum (strain Po82) TaxID=1031711 RepID=F6G2X3_RALS8|nr:PhoH family protein [Ralstonia solanacearum]AEG69338.1 phosphate starvatioN-inducible ATPase, phoh-like protein [Ralstonia solanacearum Po82]AMP70362.1 phosphate starvation-inducible protein PhoH [Ralstonia solanacearum]AMP75535.1 phosphate starvation-inducible protein PhoH [Ralstonia solanacearum]AYB60856.1 PhoH family protein [Ralstonia solanacearum]MBB6587593.1 PhoH family protein [Ralstonia solanacearum]
MPLPTMPTQPAQLLDPAEFKPFGKAARPKAGQEPRKPVPALEREALSETGRAQPKRSTTRARLGEASPMAKEDARQRPTVVAKAVDKVSTTGKSTETAPRRRARRDDGPTKLFVLDTNVLMHDPSSLFRFEEHDVYLPMMTLEELDNHKKGMSEVARNARAVSRTLDQLVAGTDGVMEDGLPLSKLGNRDAQGHLFFQTRLNDIKLPDGLPQGKADNQILGVVSALQQQRPDRHVVLVSKDINMRIKARALGLPAEDYFNDRVLEDTDLLYSGVMSLPIDFWQKHGKNIESWQDPKTGTTFYRLSGPLVPSFLVNQFVFLEPNDGSLPLYAQVKELNGKTAVLQTLKDYTHQKNNVWGVTARNREQNFALNLLMHPEIDFVSLLGQAGTGKTLLALAAGLEQVLDQKLYNEIIITRATVPVGEDIGFLPGTEEEKMQPWMGAFDDNLEVLQKSDDNAGEWGRAATQELIRSRIKVKSMNFMRGRTFVNKFLIIDEAQNLTPKQMKTLVTRAGPGTKIVCLGNIAQIDTPYLTEGSSGLTYVVDRFKGWSHGGHITLARGERSRLADHASDVL